MAQLVAMLAVIGLMSGAWILMWREYDQRWQEKNRAYYRVKFGDHQPDQLASFLTILWGMGGGSRIFGRKAFIFEVHSIDGVFEFILRLPREDAEHVARQFTRFLAGAEVEEIPWVPTPGLAYASMKGRGTALPFDMQDAEAVSTSILEALRTPEAREETLEPQVKVLRFILSPLITKVPDGLKRDDPDHAKALRNKLASPVFAVELQVGWGWDVFNDPTNGMGMFRQVEQAINANRTGGTYFKPELHVLNARQLQSYQAARIPLLDWSVTLNVAELTGMLALPFDRVNVPGITYVGARKFPLPARAVVNQGDGLVFGISDHPDTPKPVTISFEDSKRHAHIIGGTGLGKSTLLEYLAEQVMADTSKGLVLFDPNGDLADAMTEKAAGLGRDVVVFDPTDRARPIGFNLLAKGRHDPDTTTKQITAMFSSIFSANWGPQTDYLLRMAVRTLMLDPAMTLAEVPRLLLFRDFRAALVRKAVQADPFGLGPAWVWYESLSDSQRTNITAPLMNKVQVFLDNEVLRNIIGQSNAKLDMRDVVNNRKVLLVSLPGAKIGDEVARLIGSMLYMMLWWEVQLNDEGSRPDIYCILNGLLIFTCTPGLLLLSLHPATCCG